MFNRLDSVNLKTKSACDHYWEKRIEKTILRILGSCTFLHSRGHSLQKRDVRATSAFPLIATTSRKRRHFAKVPTD
jgi:hypothetical protein